MNPRYAVLSAISSLSGIWLYKYHSITGFVLSAFLVIVIVLQFKKKSVFIVCFLPIFYFYSSLSLNTHASKLSAQSIRFSGQVVSIPKMDGRLLSFQFKTNDENVIVQHRMKTSSEKNELSKLEINMTCVLEGKLNKPEPQSHFYGMNYLEYLSNKKIKWILETGSISSKHCAIKSQKSIKESVQIWRSRAIHHLEEYFSQNTAGLMNALLFGYREGIKPETLEAYQRLGLTHLLAVSGFNVGIVSFILYSLLVRAGIIKELAYMLIVLCLPLYIVLTGGESSILRAGIMGILLLCFIIFRKRISPVILLSIVCIGMLFWNPSYAFELGFQLSFLMTFVLITSLAFFQSKSYVQLLILTSCLCSLFSFPIILYHFYEFSIWSIPLNFLYIPFVSILLFPVSCMVLILTLSVPENLPYIVSIIEFIFGSSALFLERAQLLRGSIVLGKPAVWIFILYFISIFYFVYKWEVNKRLKVKSAIPFLLIIIIHAGLPYVNPNAAVSFINVGQGDSILIELPFRKAVYLIDTGGSISFEKKEWEKTDEEYNVTKQAVLPFLKARGLRRVDGMIFSHGDMDHAGGGLFLLNHFNISTVYLPNRENSNELEKLIEEEAKSQNINLIYLRKGIEWGNKDSFFSVLHPDSNRSSSNNGSIVLWVKLYEKSFLFTGDIEKEAEDEILKNYNHIHADILKAAHHGSDTSSTTSFLKKLSPSYTVISTGKNNMYGHPSLDVLERLKEEKIVIYRTDLHGDISFVVGKQRFKIVTAQ